MLQTSAFIASRNFSVFNKETKAWLANQLALKTMTSKMRLRGCIPNVTEQSFHLQVWITTLVACLCVTMSTSAVDNHQNAIADNIAGVWLKQYSVWWARLLVLGLNLPCIIVSLRVSLHFKESTQWYLSSNVLSSDILEGLSLLGNILVSKQNCSSKTTMAFENDIYMLAEICLGE